MATAKLAKQIGTEIQRASRSRASSWWYSPHMAAASRAIEQRIPHADLILEVRDARIPLSSEYELLKNYPSRSNRIIVLNKMDLANSSCTKDWIRYFELQNCLAFAVNSHNQENVKQFLNFLQAQVRELKKLDNFSGTAAIMLLGVPNVGKSALANALHKIGRISAVEKGKLKHARVSTKPCETIDISSMKIASNPSIYVLDTPGVLPPVISNVETSSKLALTGTIRDCLAGEKQLVQFFLSIVDSSKEYKKWANLSGLGSDRSSVNTTTVECSSGSDLAIRRKRQYPSDHTQDFIVQDVRGILYEGLSSGGCHARSENDSVRFLDSQLGALCEAFRIPLEMGEDACLKVSQKLLNLYRTGRLGHYTLESALNYAQPKAAS